MIYILPAVSVKKRTASLCNCNGSGDLRDAGSGCAGTVTGPGSIFYEQFSRLYRQYQKGDFAGAAVTQKRL